MKTNNRQFTTGWQLLFALLLTVVAASCGGKDSMGTENMISGATSKTWKIDEEINAAGDKNKLTKSEKQESMQFYSDGRFAMGSGGMLQTGTWSYDPTGKRLTLQFENEGMTENFEVMKLSDDEMELKAADASVLKLEAED